MQSRQKRAQPSRGAAGVISSTVLLALAGVFAAPSGLAAEWSRARILSGTGQPLNVEVPLGGIPAGVQAQAYRVQVTAATASDASLSQRADFPIQHALEPAADGSGLVLVVGSSAAVEQPVVELYLRIEGPEAPEARRVILLLSPARSARVAPVSLAAPAITGAVRVQSGDTLGEIAVRLRRQAGYDDASLFQVLAGLFEANPEAFIRNNMNLVRAGATLQVPDAAALRRINATAARQLYQQHLEAFRAMRARGVAELPVVATGPDDIPPPLATREGVVSPPAPMPPPERDTLRLSSLLPGNGTAQAATLDAQAQIDQLRDERAATLRALEAARDRVGELESTVDDMRRLLELQNDALARLQDAATATPVPENDQAVAPVVASPQVVGSAPADASVSAANDSAGSGAAASPAEAEATAAATGELAAAPESATSPAPTGGPQGPATATATAGQATAPSPREPSGDVDAATDNVSADTAAEPVAAPSPTSVEAQAEEGGASGPAKIADEGAATVTATGTSSTAAEAAPVTESPDVTAVDTDRRPADAGATPGSASRADSVASASTREASTREASTTDASTTDASTTDASTTDESVASQTGADVGPATSAPTTAPRASDAPAVTDTPSASQSSPDSPPSAPAPSPVDDTGARSGLPDALENLTPSNGPESFAEQADETGRMPALRMPPPARPQDQSAAPPASTPTDTGPGDSAAEAAGSIAPASAAAPAGSAANRPDVESTDAGSRAATAPEPITADPSTSTERKTVATEPAAADGPGSGPSESPAEAVSEAVIVEPRNATESSAEPDAEGDASQTALSSSPTPAASEPSPSDTTESSSSDSGPAEGTARSPDPAEAQSADGRSGEATENDTRTSVEGESGSERELPWVGIGGLALFALLVIGLLFRRKRQSLALDDDSDDAEAPATGARPLDLDFDLDLDSPPSDEPARPRSDRASGSSDGDR